MLVRPALAESPGRSKAVKWEEAEVRFWLSATEMLHAAHLHCITACPASHLALAHSRELRPQQGI